MLRRRRNTTTRSLLRRSPLLRHGVIRCVLAANVHRPVHRNAVLTVPSFFASWLVGEGVATTLAVWFARTVGAVRRSRRTHGRLPVADRVGLGLTVAAAAALAATIPAARRSEEELHGTLATLVPEEDLRGRPRSVRAGAVVPFLTGASGRRITRGITYAEIDGYRLKLDVVEPREPARPGERRPAVLEIHGGAWVVGSEREQGVPLLNHLAANGWVGFNVEYRLSPTSKFPSHLQDCKRALAWIRENADRWNVDPDFVAVTGGSAGGHLTALMALTQGDPFFQPGFEEADTSVQAAVPFYGVYDLTDRDRDQVDTFVRFLERVVMGSHPEEDPDSWAAYSPIDRIHADVPPTLLIHGTSDVLVPVAGARRFAEALRGATDAPVLYAELQGAQHAFEIFPGIRTVNTVEYVERFLHHVHGQRTTDGS